MNEDYSIPFRVLRYDFLWYQKQMDALAKKHDKEKDLRNEAFLSKIQLGEKIIPCIIIVVYYEEHFWKGNKDLYDLFINTNEHVNNYSMRQVELCKDSTNYDNDEANLVFETTRLMIQKGKEAAMVVASMVRSERLFDIVVKETEGMINMCESLDK